MKTLVGLVDDHQLFLKSLSFMLESFGGYHVTLEALNGKDMIDKIGRKAEVPDIMLIDVNMPIMDGIQTAYWLHEHYPAIHLVALSMNDSDKSIIAMIRAGCCSYLLKDTHPNELEKALLEIRSRGYYNADACNINYRRLLQAEQENKLMQLNDRERTFLQLACSELTYKQIASEMNLSERTVDGYRETLFKKFNVQTRVGLCLEAIRKEMVII